jgi:hypothetical protein
MPGNVGRPAREFRHSGLEPESSTKPANAMFQAPLDTGFPRHKVKRFIRIK